MINRSRDPQQQARLYTEKVLQPYSTHFDAFKLSPVLHITDVEMLCLRTTSHWRPRRFTWTWTLYDTTIHATYINALVPSVQYVEGTWISVCLLRGCINEALGSPTQTSIHIVLFDQLQTHQEELVARNLMWQFTLYRLRDFTLSHTVSESEIPFTLIRQITDKWVGNGDERSLHRTEADNSLQEGSEEELAD